MGKTNMIKALVLLAIALMGTCIASAYSDEDTMNDGESLALEVLKVKVDGNEVENGDTITTKVERGEDLEIKVQLFSNESIDDVEVEAFIKGDDRNTISDTSEVFDVRANEVSWENLDIKLPDNMDQDHYDLRVLVASRYGAAKIYNYNLRVSTDRHAMEIRDVVLSPQYGVKAGNGLFATVRLKNTGLKDEEGIKVTVSVPALGLSYSDYIDELEAEDQITSEELWLGRVPACAEPGQYTVEVEVEFDDYSRSVSTTETLRVFEGELCDLQDGEEPKEEEPKESIQVPTTKQDVQAGIGGVVYALVINNPTNNAKDYTISVSGVEGWGTARVDPSNTVIVGAGESEMVSVYVTANQNVTAGEKTFVASVKGDDSTADVVLTANVLPGEDKAEEDTGVGLVQALQIALLVLVVLLIILGLVLIFNRAKGKDNEMMDETQSYY